MTLEKIILLNGERIKSLQCPVQSLARKLCEDCKNKLNVVLYITSTLRTLEEQAQLYANGRTTFSFRGVVYKSKTLEIVTRARPGKSWHNYGVAFDVVPCYNNSNDYVPEWNHPNWLSIGKIGKDIGLEWGGDWTNFPDRPHFQLTNSLALSTAYANVILDNKQLIMHSIGEGYEFIA